MISFSEAQAKVAASIRAKVIEIQTGGVEAPYVRYFEDMKAIEDFRKRTGFRVEVLTHPESEPLKKELEKVEAKISKLTLSDSHLDSVQQHFHLGRVGGSGRNVAKLNARRERFLDKTIDQAREYTSLAAQRSQLLHKIDHIESGRKEHLERAKNELLEALKHVEPGDALLDAVYGRVEVVRRNRKTITIKLAGGYQEPRAMSFFLAVLKNDKGSSPAPKEANAYGN